MEIYEKIYFEAEINNQYLYLKNNVELLYFIFGRAKLRWNISSSLGMSEITRDFQQMTW